MRWPAALLAAAAVSLASLPWSGALDQEAGEEAASRDLHHHHPDASHQDARCLCKCPDVSTVGGEGTVVDLAAGSARRSVYINSSVTPADCDCEAVVLTHVNMSRAQADSFCPRCKCEYQTRNLSVIKVVVILVIWVISILVIYMGFLSCLDPILNGTGRGRGAGGPASTGSGLGYQEQRNATTTDEDDDEGANGGLPAGSGTPMSTYGSSVMNRVGSQQSRWKRQVQEQRRNIYDRHAMLN